MYKKAPLTQSLAGLAQKKKFFTENARPDFYTKFPLTQCVRRCWDKKALFTENV